MTNIAIINKYKVVYGLSIGIFTFDLARSKGQGHVTIWLLISRKR